MNKKIYAYITIVAILIGSIILIISMNKNKGTKNVEKVENLNYKYDNLADEYVIYDENGIEKSREKNKEDMQIYVDLPEYNPDIYEMRWLYP